jgi:hypothetical protein
MCCVDNYPPFNLSVNVYVLEYLFGATDFLSLDVAV